MSDSYNGQVQKSRVQLFTESLVSKVWRGKTGVAPQAPRPVPSAHLSQSVPFNFEWKWPGYEYHRGMQLFSWSMIIMGIGCLVWPSTDAGTNLFLFLFFEGFGGLFLIMARTSSKRKQRIRPRLVERRVRPPTLPPIWPPRRPDDWGLELTEEHQRESRERARYGMSAVQPPTIPSWEAHHAAEQARDPRQIRWAQSEHGDWVKVEWGNHAMVPTDGGPFTVAQAMKREDTGHWVWVNLGRNISLDWQRGPPRLEKMQYTGPDGAQFLVIRPMGSPTHQDAPPPLEPNDEHGSSDWGTPDDLANLGAVHTESKPHHNPTRGPERGRDALDEALRNAASNP